MGLDLANGEHHAAVSLSPVPFRLPSPDPPARLTSIPHDQSHRALSTASALNDPPPPALAIDQEHVHVSGLPPRAHPASASSCVDVGMVALLRKAAAAAEREEALGKEMKEEISMLRVQIQQLMNERQIKEKEHQHASHQSALMIATSIVA